MSKNVHRRTDCRLCGSSDLICVLSLEPTPPANAFVAEAALGQEQERFELDVFFCADCCHVQLCDVVDPEILFRNYVYVSGTSPAFVRHFSDYARAVTAFQSHAPGGLVVDIGSNDGTLLRFFQQAGYRTLGIDPAREIAAQASKAGIETLPEFFNKALSLQIREERGPASIITANNVFAHVDDLRGMAVAVRELLGDDGVFVFEVSYLLDVFEKTLFDTIYHEHLAYHSVKPLDTFLRSVGLELIHVDRVSSHGGSIRAYAQKAQGPFTRDETVEELIAIERDAGLHSAETLRAFSAKIEKAKNELVSVVRKLRAEGKRIAAFGAPAKATTLLYHFGLGPDVIDFIVDDSPLKQGLYSPGLHIPVLPTKALYEHKCDAVVVLAWNFAEPIIKNHQKLLEAGMPFVVPLPVLRIYPES